MVDHDHARPHLARQHGGPRAARRGRRACCPPPHPQLGEPLAELALSLGGAVVLYDLVKVLVGRPRPRVGPLVSTATGYAFPSGHATQTAALAVTLAAALTSSWAQGHAPGATFITGAELPRRLEELDASPRPMAVICGSGYRSSVAASVLARSGRRRILNTIGDMGAWNAAALPTNTSPATGGRPD